MQAIFTSNAAFTSTSIRGDAKATYDASGDRCRLETGDNGGSVVVEFSRGELETLIKQVRRIRPDRAA
jgi:hypothetical protein